MDNDAIIGDVRATEEPQRAKKRIPTIYKFLFAIQIICLATITGLAYSVV